MLDFVKKHMGWITFFVILGAFAAPTIFTMSGFECFNKTTTGQIGDTIGGTTAPFWGFLSVILLYLTFKEQLNFNKEQMLFNRSQQVANNCDLLMKIRDNISSLCNALELNIVHQRVSEKSYFKGASFIEELRNTTHPDNYIEEAEFDNLYKNVVEIAELCLLYYNVVQQSSLEKGLKKTFIQPILIHSESINRLFFLYQQRHINIIRSTSSLEDDLFARYSDANKRFLDRFKNALLYTQNI